MSVDGYIGGPDGELDWMQWNWDDELVAYVNEITKLVDCIVLGRKLAQVFIPHWAAVAKDVNHAEYTAGIKFTNTPKVVFTKTLNNSPWEHTNLATGDLVTEITNLKQQAGNDIIVYGGAAFVSALIKNQLIDEYHLLVDPTALGNGLSIFSAVDAALSLRLVKSRSFSCGIVVLNYVPKDND